MAAPPIPQPRPVPGRNRSQQHSRAAVDAGTELSTRDRLLAAAYELLLEEGYMATTVQAVASRAGLTTGAIYANFGGKQDLMATAVIERWHQTMVHPDADAAAADLGDVNDVGDITAPGDQNDADNLTVSIARHLAQPLSPEHRLLTEVTGAVIREDLSESSPLVATARLIEHVTRRSVEARKAAGEIAAEIDTDALVAVLVNIYLGAITSKSLGFPQPRFDAALDVLRATNSGFRAGPPSRGATASDQST